MSSILFLLKQNLVVEIVHIHLIKNKIAKTVNNVAITFLKGLFRKKAMLRNK